MADLIVTPAQVVPESDAVFLLLEAGAAIEVGEVAYPDAADGNKAKLADANASAVAAAGRGVAVSKAYAAGQRVVLQIGGGLVLGAGAAPVAGTLYVVSANPGKIAPAADIAAGWFVTQVGVGKGGNAIDVRVWATGRQA